MASKEVPPVTAEPLSNLDRSTLRERALEALRSAITSARWSWAPTSASVGAPSGKRCATSSRRDS